MCAEWRSDCGDLGVRPLFFHSSRADTRYADRTSAARRHLRGRRSRGGVRCNNATIGPAVASHYDALVLDRFPSVGFWGYLRGRPLIFLKGVGGP